MRYRAFAIVAAYALISSFTLGVLRWLAWLGGVLWPVVLLAPVLYILAKKRASAVELVVFSVVGMVAAFIGYGLSQYAIVPSPWRSFGVIAVVGNAPYAIAIIALVITTVVWFRNAGKKSSDAAPATSFYWGAAWLSLVAVVLLGEAYVFGSSVKSCADFSWGFMGLLFSPIVIMVRPVILLVPALAFFAGGYLRRFIAPKRALALSIFALLAFVCLIAGYVVTPVAGGPCTPI